MKITLSAIKADIGSIGGHIKPSNDVFAAVQDYIRSKSKGIFIDYKITYTGDDIAILSTHTGGQLNEKVHRVCWEAFLAGGKVAASQGLYGAKQDLLKQDFKGSVKGMGPAVAELEFEERSAEPFLFFAADKTDPGAFNMPAYLSFCDPMHNAGLLISSKLREGFTFRILDASYTEADRIIELNTPENIYDIAVLLRDTERFFIEGIYSRASGEQVVAVSTTRLRNIAGKYTGKDDPVMLVRTQKDFPGTGEVLSPWSIGAFVAGFMRGSHYGPLMPVKQNSDISFFDGPPIVSAAAYSIHDGKLTEAADAFDHPYWDYIRTQVSRKAEELRRQGFFGPAMLPYSELEYGEIVEVLQELDKRFIIKK
ncbi:MAG: fructose 1,6-bisphosphatase [Candidatus Paceibacterota bacterium]|jgi:fructose 1,6-bisphosphate aldolase/phosphatase